MRTGSGCLFVNYLERRLYTVRQRSAIFAAAVKKLQADSEAAKADLEKLKKVSAESWSAYEKALAESRAAFDRATQKTHDAFDK